MDIDVEGEDLDNVSDDEDCYGGMSSPEEQSGNFLKLNVSGFALPVESTVVGGKKLRAEGGGEGEIIQMYNIYP